MRRTGPAAAGPLHDARHPRPVWGPPARAVEWPHRVTRSGTRVHAYAYSGLVAARGRAAPTGPRPLEHDAVRPGPLHLDVALGARLDAKRLLDVVTTARSGRGEPLGDRLEALDLKANVVNAGEALAALAAGGRVVLEIEDREIDVAV